MEEKEHSENIVESLKKEIEAMNRTHEHQIEQIETKAKQMEEQFSTKVKEMEYLLLQSNKKIEEVEAASELNRCGGRGRTSFRVTWITKYYMSMFILL
jgi:kinesin family member C2/C3